MDYSNELCLASGLDPREEFEALLLVEVATRDAPGTPVVLPDIPLEAVLRYLAEQSNGIDDSLSAAKGFIDAEVAGTHTAMRGVAEKLRRNLIQAAAMYDKSGRKVTPELREFIRSAQDSARQSLSEVPVSTRSFRLYTENGFSLQFGAVKRPWAPDVRGKLVKPPIRLYNIGELSKNSALASNKQVYFRKSEQILAGPRGIAKVLTYFNNLLFAVELAPEAYNLYQAASDADLENVFKSLQQLAKIGGAKLAGDFAAKASFGLCVEVGVEVTVVASPVAGLFFTTACGVGAVAAGIYVGNVIKKLPTDMTEVPNVQLKMP